VIFKTPFRYNFSWLGFKGWTLLCLIDLAPKLSSKYYSLYVALFSSCGWLLGVVINNGG